MRCYYLRMREVKLFNSLGNKKETFVPLQKGKVSFYVCGPTVYNDPHIGNFRPVIVFDAWRRLFLRLGYQVTFVSNYTDVDDKIINRAKQLGITESELTESVIRSFSSLVEEVGSMQPDITPRPTVYMNEMISYIGDLVDNGSAYEASNGDVYFKVESVEGYGELSGNTPESLNAGARIEVKDGKLSPLDFALWKKTDEGIQWDTPWSKGRPGWHTECCVMINAIFKDQGGYIDIHGGGFDLKFPHHENEIAQSKAHNHNGLARYWLHNGFINIDDEKMSKSLGNVVLAKDVVAQYGGMPFRLMVLNTHYRAPLTFTDKTIQEAETNFSKIKTALKSAEIKLQLRGVDISALRGDEENEFFDALCDDLNTPNALSVLYAEVKTLNQLLRVREIDEAALGLSYGRIRDYLATLGLRIDAIVLSEEDKQAYKAYEQAKTEKRFEDADKIRSSLMEKGVF